MTGDALIGSEKLFFYRWERKPQGQCAPVCRADHANTHWEDPPHTFYPRLSGPFGISKPLAPVVLFIFFYGCPANSIICFAVGWSCMARSMIYDLWSMIYSVYACNMCDNFDHFFAHIPRQLNVCFAILKNILRWVEENSVFLGSFCDAPRSRDPS